MTKELYKKYFELFRDKAPKSMVEWGGYQLGTPTPMASSLESCMSFYDYMDKESSLLNAGAGASSWVFRNLKSNVACTDPDNEYLEVVKSIVGGENYIHNIGNCYYVDYVYWDYGNWQRRPLMDVGLHLARKAMYIDDCHDKDVFDYVHLLSSKYNYKIIKTNSMDSFGRFGLIIQKDQNINENPE